MTMCSEINTDAIEETLSDAPHIEKLIAEDSSRHHTYSAETSVSASLAEKAHNYILQQLDGELPVNTFVGIEARGIQQYRVYISSAITTIPVPACITVVKTKQSTSLNRSVEYETIS